jgi:tetratricopeptide (TPR) repeat protein
VDEAKRLVPRGVIVADRNQEQIELVNEDLEDLDRQVAAGDLDDATAEGLRTKYVAELDRLMDERERDPVPDYGSGATVLPDSETRPSPVKAGRVSGRALAGTAIVAVAIAVIGVFAVNSLTGPSTAGTEGVASDVIVGDGPIDLSNVSNEEMESVVAENPGVVGMRLALARRYFEAGEFDRALDHYMVILEAEQHPEALANVGWMTYISGRPDVALGYVEASLQRQPGSLTAIWFLGNIQFTLGNEVAAIEALTTIIRADDIPENVKESARSLLLQMEEG